MAVLRPRVRDQVEWHVLDKFSKLEFDDLLLIVRTDIPASDFLVETEVAA